MMLTWGVHFLKSLFYNSTTLATIILGTKGYILYDTDFPARWALKLLDIFTLL